MTGNLAQSCANRPANAPVLWRFAQTMILRPFPHKNVPRLWYSQILPFPFASNGLKRGNLAPIAPRGQVKTVDENLKQLFQQLGEAMNQSLANSDEVASVIGQIKSSGYDVFLAFEATIGFSKHEDEHSSEKLGPTLVNAGGREPELKVSPQDERFLKSLRIRLDDAA